MKKILILFPRDWDRVELDGPRFRGRYQFLFEGFDRFKFPGNARLLAFNVFRCRRDQSRIASGSVLVCSSAGDATTL